MKTNLTILLLLLTLILPSRPQKAILLSSSVGYYNIRQVNNIVKLYKNLLSLGYTDSDILLLITELQPCCQKNHKFPTLSFYDGEYGNIFKDVQVDYYQSGLFLESIAEIFMGIWGEGTVNKKKLELKGDEDLFIYVTGHGGDLYFKIREREALINQQFNAIFKTLDLKRRVGKVALISDSCSAITPFENVTAPNFLALGSSSYGEKSLSHGYDQALNQPKTDDFSFYFDEILTGKALVKGLNSLESWTFQDIQQYMDITKLKVNSKLISNNISKREKITNFVKRKEPEIKMRSLKNIKKADNFFNL